MSKTTKKILIAIASVCLVVILAGVGTLVYIEHAVKNRDARFLPLIITRAEDTYHKEETFENLYALCDTLCFSGADEKIVQYFPEYLFNEAYKAKFEESERSKIGYDLFLTSYMISVYRVNGAEQMQAELEKWGGNYNFPLKRSLYLKEFVEKTIAPQKGESWVQIYQAFADYTEEHGTQEEKELAKSSCEMIQQVVAESTLPDGTLNLSKE